MRAAWKAAGIVAVLIGLAVSARLLDRAAAAQQATAAPAYRVDPMWPKMPSKWAAIGATTGCSCFREPSPKSAASAGSAIMLASSSFSMLSRRTRQATSTRLR